MTTQSPTFTGEEIIADVLLDFPEATEILNAHGIACASCHINQYETLRDGIIAHYGEDMFYTILQDLNEASEESGGISDKPAVVITDIAKAKILEFQADSQSAGFGLKVEAHNNGGEINYFLDFLEHPEKKDKVLESNGIKIFLNSESDRLLRGKQINYITTDDDEGFKFETVKS